MSGRSLLAVIVVLGVSASSAGAEVPRTGGQDFPVVAASSAGEVIAVTEAPRLVARVAPPGGGFGPPQRLSPDASYMATVAVGPTGHAVATWSEGGLEGRWLAAFRSPGSAFGPPEVLAADGSAGEQVPAAAFDASGTATVAWANDARTALLVRTRDATGRWSAPVGIAARDAFRPRLHVRADGGATLAWEGEGPQRNSSRVLVADRRPGGAFGEPKILAGVQRAPGSVVLSGNDRGDAVVAWSQLRTGRRGSPYFTVHAAFRSPGRGFGRPTQLTRPGQEAASPSVSVGPTGGMVLAFAEVQDRRLDARIRTASGALSSVTTLSRDFEENTEPIALAAGPGLVAWYDRDPGRSTFKTARAMSDGGFEEPEQRFTTRFSEERPAAFAADDGLLFLKPNGSILRRQR